MFNFMKNDSKEYIEAYAKISQEFLDLMAGRENLDLKETCDLKKYIKARTNLEKDEQELTNEEKAWKEFYQQIDSLLEQNIGTDKKQELDKILNHMDSVDGFKICIDLGKEIEELFIQQFAYIVVHEDKTVDNEYKEKKEQMENLMYDKNSTNEKSAEWANGILKLIDVYKNVLIEHLQTTNDKIQKKLSLFEQELKKIQSFIVKDTKEIFENLNEWLKLSKELHFSRVLATNSILKQVELDKLLPQRIIENSGDINQILSKEDTEKFKNDLITYATLMSSASSKEEEISKKRKSLTQKIFGDVNNNFDQELSATDKMNIEVTDNISNSLETKVWYRFMKIVYIGLWIIGLGLAFLIAWAESSFWAFIIIVFMVWALLTLFRKAFFYVALGKNKH